MSRAKHTIRFRWTVYMVEFEFATSSYSYNNLMEHINWVDIHPYLTATKRWRGFISSACKILLFLECECACKVINLLNVFSLFGSLCREMETCLEINTCTCIRSRIYLVVPLWKCQWDMVVRMKRKKALLYYTHRPTNQRSFKCLNFSFYLKKTLQS